MRPSAYTRPLALLLAFAALALPANAQAATAPSANGNGNFRVSCLFAHRAPDDPIVSPGIPGAAHMHDFFGNPSVDAGSTHESLLAASSGCTLGVDHSSYWIPTPAYQGLTGEWRDLEPTTAGIYYLGNNRDPRTVRPFPEGLRLIAGNSKASAAQDETAIGWFCALPFVGSAPIVMSAVPLACQPSEILAARVIFPDCSDGRVDSSDHKAHMAYSTRALGQPYRVCPESHPIPVPQVRLTVAYETPDSPIFRLSSGGTYSLHADFFEAWEPGAIESLVRNCIRAELFCSGDSGLEPVPTPPPTDPPATNPPVADPPATPPPATRPPTTPPADTAAPDTRITSLSLTRNGRATFRFSASEAGSRFQCSLDGVPYRACSSPYSLRKLASGSHTFRARAIDPAGNADASPASHRFTVPTAARPAGRGKAKEHRAFSCPLI